MMDSTVHPVPPSVGSAHSYNEAILIKTQILLLILPRRFNLLSSNTTEGGLVLVCQVTNPCFPLLGYACNSITGTEKKA